MKLYRQFRILDWQRFLPLLIVAVGVIAYTNSFHGSFVLDDSLRIHGDRNIRHLSVSMLYSTRPLVGLTLFLNYAIGKFNPADYHAVNLAIHIMAGLLLFGIVRRTLRLSVLSERYGRYSAILAAIISSLWVVHPLQTESVTYIIQRAESLMGLFYLLTLYCVLRGVESKSPHRWYTAAIAACALGMATKPVMVTAPVMVFLYDRFFISTSAANALRSRWSLYAGLAATWIVLVALLSVPHESSSSAGFGANIASPISYFLTQQGVLIHYLKLTLWPRSLCLDYGWPPALTHQEILAPGVMVASLILVTLWASIRRHPAGFAGLWFFITLAPSSSIVPVADYAAEHRLYLPLVGVVVFVVFAAYELLDSLANRLRHSSLRNVSGIVLFIIILTILSGLTIMRNHDYRSVEAISLDIIEKRPDNFRARTALIYGFLEKQKFVEAERSARRFVERVELAIKSNHPRYKTGTGNTGYYYPVAQNQLGRTLLCQGKHKEAINHFVKSIMARPDNKMGYNNLGLALYLDGRVDDANREWNKALALDRQYSTPHTLRGIVAAERREFGKAIEHYRQVLDVVPESLFVQCELAWILATCPVESLRDGTASIEFAASVCEATEYRSLRAMDVLAAAYAEAGQFNKAVQTAQRALKLASEKNSEIIKQNVPGERDGIDLSALTKKDYDSVIDEIKDRISLYENKKPFRDTTGRDRAGPS